MTKYLKISIDGPYINSNRTHYEEVSDDYDAGGKDREDASQRLEEAVWDYVEAYSEVVDESEVPEDER